MIVKVVLGKCEYEPVTETLYSGKSGLNLFLNIRYVIASSPDYLFVYEDVAEVIKHMFKDEVKVMKVSDDV